MSIKLRLDYFLMRGGLLAVGDVYEGVHGDLRVARSKCEAEIYSDPSEHDNKRFINSFAPRKNNGSQPVPDDFPVRIILANRMEWRTVGAAITPFCAWYPDIEKLSEQQIEYDKQQEQPIEELMINAKCKSSADYEKKMKIVEAVNGMKAENAPSWATTVYIHSSDGHLFGCNVTNQTVCTIEEYNQCIEEMKYHYDIPRWCSYNRADKEPLTVENSDQSFYEEKFVYGQDVYVSDCDWASNPMKFERLTLDGKRALLSINDGGDYYIASISKISSKPIKSKEDIELEEAKRKQVGYMASKYKGQYSCLSEATAKFTEMQENGDLAEIILPLEES